MRSAERRHAERNIPYLARVLSKMNCRQLNLISFLTLSVLCGGCADTGPNTQQGAVGGAALGAIAGAIIYLEMHRVAPLALPTGSADVIVGPATTTPTTAATPQTSAARIAEKEKEFEPAKELTDPTGFINTPPFTIQSLIGRKVVLIDFWTY